VNAVDAAAAACAWRRLSAPAAVQAEVLRNERRVQPVPWDPSSLCINVLLQVGGRVVAAGLLHRGAGNLAAMDHQEMDATMHRVPALSFVECPMTDK
jgi:hypothetical protein